MWIDLALLCAGLTVLGVLWLVSEVRYWRGRSQHYERLYIADRELHEAEFSRN